MPVDPRLMNPPLGEGSLAKLKVELPRSMVGDSFASAVSVAVGKTGRPLEPTTGASEPP